MMTMCQTDGLNPPRWRYKGRSFIIGFSDTNEKVELEYADCELLGRRVGIESSALKQLAGQTLDLRRVGSARGLMKMPRYVLVANLAPESPAPGFEMNASAEQARRVLSIAALTILGGFTGMGMVWIASALTVSLLRIPFERLFSIMFPLFVLGWIAGCHCQL